MISKQETFKKLLSNHYKSITDLDEELWTTMKKTFWWSLTLTNDDKDAAFKSVSGNFYVKNIYENSSEWHKDIRACLKELGRL